MSSRPSSGFIMLLALVFGAIFFMVLTALSGYILSENRIEDATRVKAEAFSVAEAGLEYYRWHLARYPSDFQNGTGHAGPYSVTIPDPEGGTAGTASLQITANTACGQTTSVDISSSGTASESATPTQTLTARYARPSVALYSFIVNDSVWAGSDRTINGPFHSNGGVRMDGTANAAVTSSLSTWDCTSAYGCTTEQSSAPGVLGSGSDSTLWEYPTPQVDFAAISANFTSLKSNAQASGIYLPRYSSGNSTNASYHRGYHLIFNANGTVTVKRVSTATKLSVSPLNTSDPNYDYALLTTETTYNTYTISSNCGLIFVEDNAWIEGVIPSKVTVVVANVSDAGVVPDAFLKGNITYGASDGTDGFTLISDHDILITPDSPQNMTLRGIFVAQSGAFGRNLYDALNILNIIIACNSSYEPRTSLTLYGSTISDKRTGTKWQGGCFLLGDGGYQTRTDTYDRTLASDPPPFTPAISTDYHFVDWQQQ